MQAMTIHFVETMRGYGTAIVPQTSDASAQTTTAAALAPVRQQIEDDRLAGQILAQALREGHAFPLALRQIVVSVNTAVFTDGCGLHGAIESGIVEIPG